MNISYKWLREYVDCPLSAEEVAVALTSIGLEVGGVEEVPCVRGGLKGLFVGEVLSCEAHPNSDHLHVCMVDLGKDAPQQIVCGAPNVAAGQKVIVADLGCVLYDGDRAFEIKRSKLRGVESLGMICAEDEIGLGTSHDGIMVLPADARVGTPAADYFGMESDYQIEVDITANRADALSHWGVARDLSAWLCANGIESSLHRPSCDTFAVDNHELEIDVEIVNTDACRRYMALSITGCEVKESPAWLQSKLTAIGLRPINNIVDITNYVMMAYGQPMHCFDADMVEGNKIVVRTASEGTPFVTLDGEEHSLGEYDLAICNAREPMCIAGVFGGKGSGTYDTTTNVVLEAAYFHPTWIRKSARRHGLSTDASFRFERGIDPNGLEYAMKQAAILCKELAGGKVSMEIKDVYPRPIANATVELHYDYAFKLIGKDIGKDTVKNIAQSLEMTIVSESEQSVVLSVPAYRVDVHRPCDVVEDILRIYGYNNVEIPTALKSSLTIPEEQDAMHRLENTISEQLVGCGFNEIMNNSLTKTSYYSSAEGVLDDDVVEIVNPLSADLGVMRKTLLYGGLESVARNINRKLGNLRFFEFGNTYTFAAEKLSDASPIRAYSESKHLALWVTGKRFEGSWIAKDEPSCFYELKAYVHNILNRLGLGHDPEAMKHVTMTIVGTKTLRLFGIAQHVYYAEMNWDALMRRALKHKVEVAEISKYPPVSRDLALLIDRSVEFAQVEAIAKQCGKKLLKSVKLFDVYEGKNLPEGKKSYAVNFILQDTNRTLDDKPIDNIMNKIITSLKQQLGAELR